MSDYAWIDESQQFNLPANPKPLFPDAVGEVLHGISHLEPHLGPPYTHTIPAPPGWEYNDEGEPIRPLFYPTMTVVRHVQDEDLAEAYNAAGRRLYGTDVHPLLRDHGIDRSLRWGPSRLRNGIRRGSPAAYRRGAAPGS